jgi:hypothetical protein
VRLAVELAGVVEEVLVLARDARMGVESAGRRRRREWIFGEVRRGALERPSDLRARRASG